MEFSMTRRSAPVAKRAITICLSLMLLVLAALPGVLTVPANAADASDNAIISVTSKALGPNEDLTLNVTISNNSSTTLSALSLRVGVSQQLVEGSTELEEWLSQKISADTYIGPTAYLAGTADVEPGETVTRKITIQGRFLGLHRITDDSGVVPYAIKLLSNHQMIAATAGGILWNQDESAPVSMVVPISGTLTDGATYSASELADMTSKDGTLTTQLAAVGDAPVALLTDPKIVSSIQILGDAAPTSAKDWLNKLRSHSNLIADLWGGADPLALSARKRVTITSKLAGDFDWQSSTWLIPSSGQYRQSVINYAKRAGFSTVVVQDSDIKLAANPSISGVPIAVSLSAANTAVANYLASPTEANLQLITAGIVAGASPYSGRPLVVVPATWKFSQDRLQAILGQLSKSTSGVSLRPNLQNASGVVTSVSLTQTGKSKLSTKSVRGLLDQQRRVEQFSYIANPASQINLPNVRQVASLLNPLWATRKAEWNIARKTYLANSKQLTESVQITNHGSLTMVSRTSQVPVMVKNTGSTQITATVRINPTNGRVVSNQLVKVVVGPGKTVTAKVPVTAVANGRVGLRVQLLTSQDKAIGTAVTRQMVVRSQLETWTFVSLAAAVIGLFAFGLVRGFRRNRRAAAAADDGEVTTTSAAAPEATQEGADDK